MDTSSNETAPANTANLRSDLIITAPPFETFSVSTGGVHDSPEEQIGFGIALL